MNKQIFPNPTATQIEPKYNKTKNELLKNYNKTRKELETELDLK